MNGNFGKSFLLILLLKNFGWMKRSIIVSMDGNSVRLLIFYITEAITISTIGFSYSLFYFLFYFHSLYITYISLNTLKYFIQTEKENNTFQKLLETKLTAVFTTPKKFPGGLMMTCLAFSTSVLVDMGM